MVGLPPLFQIDHQHRQIRRAHPGDAAGLAQAHRADLGELFGRLQPQPPHLPVVQPLGQADRLHPPQLLHLGLLFFDVSLVFDLDLHLLGGVRVQGRPARVKGGQVPIGDLGALEKLRRPDAGLEGGGALRLQHPIEGRGGGEGEPPQPGQLPGFLLLLPAEGL